MEQFVSGELGSDTGLGKCELTDSSLKASASRQGFGAVYVVGTPHSEGNHLCLRGEQSETGRKLSTSKRTQHGSSHRRSRAAFAAVERSRKDSESGTPSVPAKQCSIETALVDGRNNLENGIAGRTA